MSDSASPGQPADAGSARDGALGPLTVAIALREPALGEARIVAAQTGLEHRIDSVGVLDLSELEALAPNSLVLSSAHPLRNLDLRRLVGRLAERGVSALGVKPGKVWARLPDDLVAACEERALPLLALPPGRFEAIVNPVLKAIAERQSEGLHRIGELHDALTGAALGNEPMPAITAIVARALGVPVAVFDEYGALVAGTGDGALWSPDVLACEVRATPGRGTLEVDGRRYLLAAISTVGRRYGALCAAGVIEKEEDYARAALAQAAVVCGMQLVGRQRVEAVHRKFERQLLEELVDHSLTPREAQQRADRLRWPRGAPYLVMLISRRPRERGGPLEVARFALDNRSADAFARALVGGNFRVRSFPRRQGLGLVVHVSSDQDRTLATEAVRRRLASLRVVPWVARQLSIGVSSIHAEVTELPEALREAMLALMTSGPLRAGQTSIAYFDDLGLGRLLAAVDDVESLATMAQEALGPLADPAVPGRQELLATLAALAAHNMRLVDASADLYFHYNTIRHRLARLRRLLGQRIEEPEGRLSLSLALAALHIVAVERPDVATSLRSAALSAEPSSARTRPRPAPRETPRAR